MKYFIAAALVVAIFFFAASVDAEGQSNSGNEVLRYGRCSTTSCPNEWKPVCASNNRCIRTFNNSCLVRLQNCRTSPKERYNIVPNHYCKNAKPCQ